MMKTIYATGDYTVSFNCRIYTESPYGDNWECGESSMDTVDYAGNDIPELIDEVIREGNEQNPPYPMRFVFNDTGYDMHIIGHFSPVDEDDDWIDAVLFEC